MKIVMLTGYFHPHLGGAEKETKRLALQFREGKNKIIIICHRYLCSLKQKDFLDNIPIFRYTTLLLKKRDLFSMILGFPYILFTVRKFKPDIIYSAFSSINLFICLWLKRFLKTPVVSSIRGTDIFRFPKKNVFYKKIIKWNLKNVDMVIPVAKVAYQEAKKYGDIRKKAKIIQGEVDINKFEITENKSLINKYQLKNKFVIMTLCRLSRVKRVDILLRSFKIALSKLKYAPDGREIILMICGDGEEKGRLEKISKDLGVSEKTIFTGEIPPDEVPHYLSLADLYVSTSEYEVFSHTTIEAMMSGLPIISTNIQAYEDILHGAGLMVPLNDPKSLSNAIINLIKDDKKRKIMGRDSRKISENFYSRKDTINEFLKVFETVIKSKN